MNLTRLEYTELDELNWTELLSDLDYSWLILTALNKTRV